MTLLVGGVGYELNIPTSLAARLHNNVETELFIHTHVREDLLALYGFGKREELLFFKLLISVSGIGPKVALAIISAYSIEKLKNSLVSGDPSLISSVSGVGKKTAEKAILELRGKVGGVSAAGISQESGEVLEALVGLGFHRVEAVNVLADLPEASTSEEKLKQALKVLGRGRGK